MSSILTNNSAMVALQTLKSINSQLGKTQSDIATGKTVANAKDNAAVWAISKVMETDQSAFKTIQSNLNVADAVVGTARAGAEQITDLLKEMKNLAIGGANDAADFAKIDTDMAKKIEQITAIIEGTQLNGVNLLKTEPTAGNTAFTVLGSLDRTNGAATTGASNIEVDSVDFEAGLDLTSIGTISDRASAEAAITALEDLIDIAVQGAADLGSAGKRISDQSSFVGKLSDSLKTGIGSLVDADMEEASARLQALQTQQQLGIQALSIANQGPSAVMSLFR
ncbi:flagellin [Paracoccus hibiscisoli]|uniref:Flagellin n=1 Tax=Paracoccus hibiscisoli TaxID=2023261 RepID=A0A4U0R079_9RHOB|nr:flagellin [Paracoccus hibiscisoli]TJZ87312.1 flagellin [Paracoccus hibiscisoli]